MPKKHARTGQPQQRSLAARKKWARLALPNSLGKLLTLRPPAGERLQVLTMNPTEQPRQNEYSSTTEEKSEVNPRFNGHRFIDSGLRCSAKSHNPPVLAKIGSTFVNYFNPFENIRCFRRSTSIRRPLHRAAFGEQTGLVTGAIAPTTRLRQDY
jgi:hypothetical protein